MKEAKRILASLALAVWTAPLLAQTPAAPTPEPITIHSAEASGVAVYFLNIPWGPQTFAAMERPESGFYNTRTWPFARMETKVPLTLSGTRIPPGTTPSSSTRTARPTRGWRSRSGRSASRSSSSQATR